MEYAICGLVGLLVGLAVGMFYSENNGDVIRVYSKSYPIIVVNEFNEEHISSVKYWINQNSKTKKYTLHHKGEFSIAHEGYNIVQSELYNLISKQ